MKKENVKPDRLELTSQVNALFVSVIGLIVLAFGLGVGFTKIGSCILCFIFMFLSFLMRPYNKKGEHRY